MPTLKQGDLIRNGNGVTRKVMEVCGTILHISFHDDHARYFYTTDEAALKKEGFTWYTPAWEPSIGEKYWFIVVHGEIYAFYSNWNNDEQDKFRRDFLGISKTKELCEAALLEIRRKLGK